MIFCFSGNGNSLCVARSLGRKLNEGITQITASTPDALDAREWRRVVWVFPVYSWGMPAPVKRFIRTVSLDGLHRSRPPHMAQCREKTRVDAKRELFGDYAKHLRDATWF